MIQKHGLREILNWNLSGKRREASRLYKYPQNLKRRRHLNSQNRDSETWMEEYITWER